MGITSLYYGYGTKGGDGGSGGGGGGNGGFGNYTGGNGGSGIVIIKYLTSSMSINAPTATQTTNGDYTILTFTITGNHIITVN